MSGLMTSDSRTLLKPLETGYCRSGFFDEALEKDDTIENNQRLRHGVAF